MKKLLLIVVFVLGFFVSRFSFHVSQVSADNDSLSVFCDVSVNGVALSTDSNSAPIVTASRKEGENFVYPFRVCGDLSLVSTLPPPSKPVINLNTSGFDFSLGTAQRMQLVPDGSCWKGEYVASFGGGVNKGTAKSVYDVEGNDPGFTPICHRVFAQLSPTTVVDQSAWNEAMNMCSTLGLNPTAPVHSDDVTVKWTVPQAFMPESIMSSDGLLYHLQYHLIRSNNNEELENFKASGVSDPNQSKTENNLQAGNYNVKFVLEYNSFQSINVCEKSFNVGTPASPGGMIVGPGGVEDFKLCAQAGDEKSPERGLCQACFNKNGIWTGVGCIPYSDTAELVRAFITLGLGLAGTVVILMTLAGAFLMSTSRGEPQRIDEAKSLITSAIAGILFLIFSVSILQFIGVNILHLPGFG